MKKEYENADLEVIIFEKSDIVTESTASTDPSNTDWGGGQGFGW